MQTQLQCCDQKPFDLPDDVSLLKGDALRGWCCHAYRMRDIGLQTESIENSFQRVLNPAVLFLVFIDLDETLTATNEDPTDPVEGVANPRCAAEQEAYIRRRVPAQLALRLGRLLSYLSSRNDVAWFVLTDNVYLQTKCTLKLGLDIDVERGTIVDRVMRSNVSLSSPQPSADEQEASRVTTIPFLKKAQFMRYCIALRRQKAQAPPAGPGWPPLRGVVFADNAREHRESTAAMFQRVDVPNLVCCEDLTSGLTAQHIEEIYQFLESA